MVFISLLNAFFNFVVEISADSLYRTGSLESIYGVALRYKAQIPVLQKTILILAEMLVLGI